MLSLHSVADEMGDLCETTFGTLRYLPDGAPYDIRLGHRLYLTQELWVNAEGGYCAMRWPGEPAPNSTVKQP